MSEDGLARGMMAGVFTSFPFLAVQKNGKLKLIRPVIVSLHHSTKGQVATCKTTISLMFR